MSYIKQMRISRGITVGELVDEMNSCGVLGAGRIGKATEILTEMFSDPECTVFLTLAGPLVPGGLRRVISSLIEGGYVDVVVTTGANMVHDLVEALGFRHAPGSFQAIDKQLKTENVGRIGDIYIEHSVFEHLETWIFKILEDMPEVKKSRLSITDLLFEMGKKIREPESILAVAAMKEVPIICPAFVDSIAGFHLWLYGQDKKMVIDPLLDVTVLMDKVLDAKRAGIIILGGGYPKHFALFANTFREGVDLAIQITMDRPEHGGLSGAPLEEAISWSKVKPDGKIVTVICDVTIAFPLIVAAAFEKLETTEKKDDI